MCDEPAYYRDVYIWLPEQRWGNIAWPPCPTCLQQDVAAHGFQTNHFGRRVVSMTSNYFIMSRRYICQRRCCQGAPSAVEKRQQRTFMGYNPISRTHLPHGLGRLFPAFLSFRAAVDNSVIDMMRALFDKGVRPESFAETILELHSKTYFEAYLLRELEIERTRAFLNTTPSMFSEFADKRNYAGLVPTGKYLSQVYKQYNATIRNHMEKEIKKQPSSRFHIDASYKEAKHLAQYHGIPLFKALMTVTNEFGAIRLQFHTVADGHDQMEQAVSAFVKTAQEYGQPLPEIAATDNPSRDQQWLYDMIPSLKNTQQQLDDLTKECHPPAAIVAASTNEHSEISLDPEDVQAIGAVAATSTVNCIQIQSQIVLVPAILADIDRVRVASSVDDINLTVLAMRQLVATKALSERAISLDAEWDTKINRSGQVIGASKTALIQLGYRDSENRMSALILQVFRHQMLPRALLALFAEPSICFVGVSVSGDLKRIGKDFNCMESIECAKFVNLGSHARKRDVVHSGTASLEKLVQLMLREKMDKSPSVRLSKWSRSELCDAQKQYAALDAMKSLEVYEQLQHLPDLTLRLAAEAAIPNLQVDVVPSHGNVASMATRAAVGMLSDAPFCKSPDGVIPSQVKPNQNSRVVAITSVVSPSLVVPGLKKGSKTKRESVCLRDFGTPPFTIVLPLKMLKHHVDSTMVRIFSDESTSSAVTNTVPTRTAQPINPLNHCDVLHFSATDDRLCNNDMHHSDNATEGEGEPGVTWSTSVTSDALDLVALAGLVGNQVAVQGQHGGQPILPCEHLDEPPSYIADVFSACLGDAYHAMSRPKVPIKHEFKKPYFVALQQAFFAWRPGLLTDVLHILEAKGFSKQDIKAKMYYDIDFFRQRVDRRILPPRQLYWRVRSVFVLFGGKLDSKSKMPLFNTRAWKKANNVLKEVLKGFYSDPPGISFYTNRLDRRGEPMVDQYGISLLDCNRGTNDVEAIHKQRVALYGTWKTGVQMSDALLSERRHRYNHKINERKRLGFPKFGHYDTWLVDALQLLVEKNHHILLYADWSDASDYKDTPESFGTVALHSTELHEAVEAIELSDNIIANLSEEKKYLARATSVKVPFLPLHGAEEAKLFNRLVLEMPQFNELSMSIMWCRHVDGFSVFPKLPVYLRLYYERWERNQRVRDAVQSSKNELQLLEMVNNDNMLHPCNDDIEASQIDELDDTVLFCENKNVEDDGAHVNNADSNNKDGAPVIQVVAAGRSKHLNFSSWANVNAPVPMLQPHYMAIRPHGQLGPPTVGGFQIGVSSVRADVKVRQRRNMDKRMRQKRTCKRCELHCGTRGWVCNGRKGGKGRGQDACEFFDAAGSPLINHTSQAAS